MGKGNQGKDGAMGLKCDKVSSVAMPTEEWALVERVARESGTTRNDLIRRCVQQGLRSLLVAGLCPVNLDRMLREARGELLIPVNQRELLTGD